MSAERSNKNYGMKSTQHTHGHPEVREPYSCLCLEISLSTFMVVAKHTLIGKDGVFDLMSIIAK